MTLFQIKFMKLFFSGEYKQNLCLSSDPNCQPCPTRFPSCLGLSDGKFAHPSHLWGQDYIMCFHNRTIEVVSCDNGYFNPRTRRCSSYIDPGLILHALTIFFLTKRSFSNYFAPIIGN